MNSWHVYSQIKALIDGGEYQTALNEIDSKRRELEDIRTPLAVLEASSYEGMGDVDKAIAVMENVTTPNFWTFYKLASLYRLKGDFDKVYRAHQDAHYLIGWIESRENDYRFTHDYFTSNIEKWSKYFKENITQQPIKALEIGSWQGGSALWLLDNIIAKRGGKLTCIDAFEGSSEHESWIDELPLTIEQIFDRNIQKSGHGKLCRKIKGYSQNVLRGLQSEKFDFMYIDGAHEARYVIEDAVLSFGMLEVGGFILFDDYDFSFSDNSVQNTSHAVDFFISVYENEVEVIDKGRQVLLRKI
jgi:predicted O-methyltransferase YrrM